MMTAQECQARAEALKRICDELDEKLREAAEIKAELQRNGEQLEDLVRELRQLEEGRLNLCARMLQ